MEPEQEKDAAAVRVFPPAIPLLTGLAGVGLNRLWPLWILILSPVCAWLLQTLAILPEERYLERKFGETYLAYKRRVRRWL